MRKIVLAGGTGHLGKMLSRSFVEKGYMVNVLTRDRSLVNTDDQVRFVHWDGAHPGIWTAVLENADVLINLSGKSIQCRFTEANKIALENSRIIPTQTLGKAIAQLESPPRIWINFSGISIFEGQRGLHDEESKTYGISFLAQLTKKWENTFFEAITPRTHKIALRISPVFSKHAGMFSELHPLVRIGLGGQVGNGKQMVSWIHEQDLVRLVHWLIEHDRPSSLYHACSPNPVSNKELMKAFRDEVGISFGLPLPLLAAKAGAFVKGVDASLLLETVAGTTYRTTQEGFTFSYSDIREAIHQLIYQPKL